MNLSSKNIENFFKNKKGDWTIFEFPNALLGLWIVVTVVSFIFPHITFTQQLNRLGGAALFAWAYLEFIHGNSPFRKALGVLVLIVTTLSFFM